MNVTLLVAVSAEGVMTLATANEIWTLEACTALYTPSPALAGGDAVNGCC